MIQLMILLILRFVKTLFHTYRYIYRIYIYTEYIYIQNIYIYIWYTLFNPLAKLSSVRLRRGRSAASEVLCESEFHGKFMGCKGNVLGYNRILYTYRIYIYDIRMYIYMCVCMYVYIYTV